MYVLGSSLNEQERLNAQPFFLWDRDVEPYIRKSETVLELGCGVGSNLGRLVQINERIRYTGLDYTQNFIDTAKSQWAHLGTKAEFALCNVAEPVPDSFARLKGTFDIVLVRLVLWSVGQGWKTVVENGLQMLKPGGHIIIFEPDDQMLIFYPPKPNFENIIQLWQNQVTAKGQNPFIGRKILNAMNDLGLKVVHGKIFSNLASSNDQKHYTLTSQNLEKIFCGKGPSFYELSETDSLWSLAVDEIRSMEQGSIIHDGYFSFVAEKQ
jgi:2-polyprenyl-3-methyl-5-hydroxy-6-metoxy-1,4-benzoquinol methylase